MSSIDRYTIVNTLNSAVLNDSTDEVVDLLNELFSSEMYLEYIDLIYSAISIFQLYGYLEYLDKEEKEKFFEYDIYRSSSYKGNKIDFYNKGQLSLLYDLEMYNKVLFSAPTSFGKTSIVIEYILNNTKRLNNIVFIVPTNSLLEELYMKFLAYNNSLDLGYIVSNQPSKIVGRNILLLTPERFLIFLQLENLKKIDLIVMDEMYKISSNSKKKVSDFVNNRSLRFRRVADIIAGTNNKVFFLSPFTYTLTKSMSKFIDKYGIKKVDRRLEYVKREIIKASDFVQGLNGNNYEKVITLLGRLAGEQNIVYVKGYADGYNIVEKYENIDFYSEDYRYIEFCKHINANYVLEETNWSIAEAIEKGIGMYIAPMPRYIKKELVSLYERGIIKTLIVTTAFTEGVNTSAKNLIVTSMKNGDNSNNLTDIDILNVMGRVGRFSRESVGKVYCLTDEIYEKIKWLDCNGDCLLENFNYVNETAKIDYEIEMMENQYLSAEEIAAKEKTKKEMEELELTIKDFQMSLNVSNKWKICLYRYLKKLNKDEVVFRYNQLIVLLAEESGRFENALSTIFKDIKRALETNEIKAFPVQPYDIPAFDKKGEFVWGRLYKYYASGNIKDTIRNNIAYISRRYKEITNGYEYTRKKDVKGLFQEAGCEWILAYYTSKLDLNYNKFYSECFRFISNVVQYKIPFYLSFYVSIFKLFLDKQFEAEFDLSILEEKDIVLMFEEGSGIKGYQQLLDFGVPMFTLEKIREKQLSVDKLKMAYKDMLELDEYEKIMLEECFGAGIV